MQCGKYTPLSGGSICVAVQCQLDQEHRGQHRVLVGETVILWPVLKSPTRLDRMAGLILSRQDWLIAMAGLDDGPESPRSLRNDLLELVRLANNPD